MPYIPEHIRDNQKSFGKVVCTVWDEMCKDGYEDIDLLCDYFNFYEDRTPMVSDKGNQVTHLTPRMARRFLSKGKRSLKTRV